MPSDGVATLCDDCGEVIAHAWRAPQVETCAECVAQLRAALKKTVRELQTELWAKVRARAEAERWRNTACTRGVELVDIRTCPLPWER